MQVNWQPTAAIEQLIARAKILEKIRRFFKIRGVLEVETPLLSSTTATDPYIQSFKTFLLEPGKKNKQPFYLQTSPEFAMKRLLAYGIVSIYQICKAFRNEESGRLHSPEFTMLEWYRLNFDHHQLMDEVDEFLQSILSTKKAKRCSYREIFLSYLQIDPHQATTLDLEHLAKKNNLSIESSDLDYDDWLQILMSHLIEPQLGLETPIFIYDFPKSQAALSKIREDEIPVAERFEVYIKGLEIANGYHELSDAKEQKKRLKADQKKRKLLKLPLVPLDCRLIAALEHGLPHCAGIALGIDRLVMLALQKNHITEVIAFPIEQA